VAKQNNRYMSILENLKVFNSEYQPTGEIKSRETCHSQGLYHETFQCFLLSELSYSGLIYLAKRSKSKKNSPLTYEATASGHILHDESIASGVRELEEELGIKARYNDLVKVGVIHATDQANNDQGQISMVNEFANVFILKFNGKISDIKFDKNEIEGILSLPVSSFLAMLEGELPMTIGEYFNEHTSSIEQLSIGHLTPTGKNYWENLSKQLKTMLKK